MATARRVTRRWALRGLAVVLPLGLGLAAADRWAGRTLDTTLRGRLPVPEMGGAACYREDRLLSLTPVPGACGADDQGYVGTAPGVDPGSVEGRVVLVGDSIAEGFRAGGALRTWVRDAGWPEAEVWNLGVPGFDTCAEATTLEHRGWRLDPDLVVLLVCVNDFTPSAFLQRAPDGSNVLRTTDGERVLPGWARFGDLALWLALQRAAPPHAPSVDDPGDEAVRACHAEMVAAARSRGVPFVSALVPWLVDDPTEDLPALRAEARLRAILAGSGAPWVDLRAALADGPPLSSLRENPGDLIHPNGDGRRRIGRAVVDAAVAAGLLPGATPPAGAAGRPPEGPPG